MWGLPLPEPMLQTEAAPGDTVSSIGSTWDTWNPQVLDCTGDVHDVPPAFQKRMRLAQDTTTDTNFLPSSSSSHSGPPPGLGSSSLATTGSQSMPGIGMPNLGHMAWTGAVSGLSGQSFNPLVQMPTNFQQVGAYGASPHHSSGSHQRPNIVQTQTQQAEGADDVEAKRYIGRIRKFQGMTGGHGFGFIDCPEMHKRTGQDVYVHAKQTHGCQVGEEVSFTVVFNPKGEPQARNLVRAEEAPKLKEKKAREAMKQQMLLNQKRGGIAAMNHMAITQSQWSPIGSPVGPAAVGAPAGMMTEEQAKQFQKDLKRKR